MTCAEAWQNLSNLLANEAESAEVDALETHLAGCAACQELAVDLYYQDRLLIEELAAPRAQRLARRIHGRLAKSRSRRWRRWGVLLATAASLLIAVTYLLVRSHKKDETAAIADAQGDVQVVDAAGQRGAATEEFTPGRSIRTVGDRSRAAVQFSDASRFLLGANTSLQWLARDAEAPSSSQAKQLYLQAGSITAEVAAQPPDQPLVLTTPHAEIVVMGTRFQLAASTESTHLEVKEGSVQFRNRASQQMVEVNAGGQATAAPALDLRVIRAESKGSFGPGVRGVFFAPNATHAHALVQTQPTEAATLVDLGSRGSIKLVTPPTHLIRAAALSRDGKVLATGGTDKAIYLWNTADGAQLGILAGHQGSLRGLVFSPDGKTLASQDDAGTVRLWDFTEHKELGSLGQVSVATSGLPAFSPDGGTLAIPNPSARETVRMFDVATRQPIATLGDYDPATRRVRRAVCLAFAPNGKTLAVGVMDLGSSPDGTAIVPEGVRRGVDLVDLKSGKKRTLFETPNEVWSVAYSADGTTMAAACNNLFNLWDVRSAQLLAEFSNTGIYTSAVFSPGGQRIAALDASRTTIDMWELVKP
jgi:WD40 repeat protein/ferric-dicitrate binding protein FerR (iron transport regulator)